MKRVFSVMDKEGKLMKNIAKPVGLSIAIAAAGLFVAAPAVVSATGQAEVQCYGVNMCKGHNDCKTATNACKGKAKCKGQGFVMMSKKACGHIGGSTTPKGK